MMPLSLNHILNGTKMNTTPIYKIGRCKKDALPERFKYSFDCRPRSSSLERYQDDLDIKLKKPHL